MPGLQAVDELAEFEWEVEVFVVENEDFVADLARNCSYSLKRRDRVARRS